MDGQQIRDWLYVEDHVGAIWIALIKGVVGETDNVGCFNEHPVLEIVNQRQFILDRKAPSADGKPYTNQTENVADCLGDDHH